MKKSLSLLTLLICSIVYVNAQLRVDSLGKVAIDNTLNANGAVNITNATQNAISIHNTSSTISNKRVAYLSTTHYPGNTKTTYGLYSSIGDLGADSNTPGKTFGVFSQIYPQDPYVTTTTSGVRYSICGVNGERGAAIYGSADGGFANLHQSYAGYFYGKVHVQGNLTVSGNINGALLSPSYNQDSASQATELNSAKGGIGNMLQNLKAKSFFYDQPKSMESKEERIISEPVSTQATGSRGAIDEEEEEDYPEMVVIPEEEMPLNHIGQQVYSKQHYSLSADELEEIFPDLVYENEDGTKSINYVEMVPILVQAIGELSAKVAALEGVQGNSRNVKKEVTGLANPEDVTLLSLGQNKPNPFGTNTEIEVSIPETVQQAFIYVYDLQGKKVDQVDITARGKQVVRLSSENLTDGMYMYSLITDGKVVETRRMIVEK